jgi:hypothetical protein
MLFLREKRNQGTRGVGCEEGRIGVERDYEETICKSGDGVRIFFNKMLI